MDGTPQTVNRQLSIVTTFAISIFMPLNLATAVRTGQRQRGGRQLYSQEGKRMLKSSSKGSDDNKECLACEDGAIYYRYADLRFLAKEGETVSFDDALTFADPFCILAPVESAADLLEIQAVIPVAAFGTDASNVWVGIGKTAAAISDDVTAINRLSDWKNLDGSPVPALSTLWADGEPNNSPPFQTRAHFYGSNNSNKLRDLNPGGNIGPKVSGAVYRCCYRACFDPEDFSL